MKCTKWFYCGISGMLIMAIGIIALLIFGALDLPAKWGLISTAILLIDIFLTIFCFEIDRRKCE